MGKRDNACGALWAVIGGIRRVLEAWRMVGPMSARIEVCDALSVENRRCAMMNCVFNTS